MKRLPQLKSFLAAIMVMSIPGKQSKGYLLRESFEKGELGVTFVNGTVFFNKKGKKNVGSKINSR